MKAATHTGECQWCARRQMLPGGVLAKHGYTVRHRGEGGYFTGTCSGSGNLPFEISKDLIDESTAWAERCVSDLDRQIAELKATDPATTSIAWLHVYHPELSSHRFGSCYLWEKHELSTTEGGRLFYLDRHGKPVHLHTFNSIEREVRDGVAGRLRERESVRADMTRYIARQQRRIRDWKPQPLQPIDAPLPATQSQA